MGWLRWPRRRVGRHSAAGVVRGASPVVAARPVATPAPPAFATTPPSSAPAPVEAAPPSPAVAPGVVVLGFADGSQAVVADAPLRQPFQTVAGLLVARDGERPGGS